MFCFESDSLEKQLKVGLPNHVFILYFRKQKTSLMNHKLRLKVNQYFCCRCEKLPIEICGAGCITKEGQEVCHNKVVTSLVDVPEETCDLNPQKVCKFVTKLVPKLKPVPQCTLIPTETCQLTFTQPKQEKRKFRTR